MNGYLLLEGKKKRVGAQGVAQEGRKRMTT